MSGIEIFQIWVTAFFTLALFSFLYRDNPFYKVAEHIFAGLTAGYQVGLIWETVILQKLWDPMVYDGRWWLFLPGVLGIMMFARFFPKLSRISRIPLAAVMGITAGVFIIAQLHGFVLPQMKSTMSPVTQTVTTVASTYDVTTATVILGTPLPADTILGTVDTVESAPLAEIEPVDTTTSTISIPAGVLHSDADTMLLSGAETAVIRGEFRDTDAAAVNRYSLTVTARGPDGNDNVIVDDARNGDDGVSIVAETDGRFAFTAQWTPDTTWADGAYVLGMSVRKERIRLLLTLIVVIGVISTLIYFYFSHEHTGVLGVTAKVGIWFIMIAFGAHFGYTVMGRVSLLIGRAQFLIEEWIGSFHSFF